jgi:hypothetical protein
MSRAFDILKLRLPLTEIVLGVVQNLSSRAAMLIYRASIARNDGGVIEKIEETASMAS